MCNVSFALCRVLCVACCFMFGVCYGLFVVCGVWSVVVCCVGSRCELSFDACCSLLAVVRMYCVLFCLFFLLRVCCLVFDVCRLVFAVCAVLRVV